MLRLVFTDMDDTFVAPDKTIPAENLRVLDELHARGVGVVPCTGRSVAGLPRELVAHPCVRYTVCGGGAIIRDVRAGRDLAVETIDPSVVRALYDDLRELRVTFDLFSGDRILTAEDRWGYLDQIEVTEALRRMLKSLRTRVPGTTDELIDATGGVCRVNVFYVGADEGPRVWEVARAHPELTAVSSLPCNVEFTRAGVNKGSALRRVCAALGVDVADVVAFGDSGNDASMLEAAGDGVAMANATPEALVAADHVASRCEEAGVASYLRALLA
ncbi:HAD family hydrolase [Thermophilibacter sp.]